MSDPIYMCSRTKNELPRRDDRSPLQRQEAILHHSSTSKSREEERAQSACRARSVSKLNSLSRVVLSRRQMYVTDLMDNADSQYPDLDDDFTANSGNAEIEQDIDIEVNELEPSFLAGQTKITLELSPVKIIKAPDG